MGLHARQVAMAAGARGERIEDIARRMLDEGTVRLDRAEALLRKAQGGDR
jgi:hydroxymethylglutaryl-CoA reductase